MAAKLTPAMREALALMNDGWFASWENAGFKPGVLLQKYGLGCSGEVRHDFRRAMMRTLENRGLIEQIGYSVGDGGIYAITTAGRAAVSE